MRMDDTSRLHASVVCMRMSPEQIKSRLLTMHESVFVPAAAFAVASHMLPRIMGEAAQGRSGHHDQPSA